MHPAHHIRPQHQKIKNAPQMDYRSVGELFYAKAREFPEKIFLICPGKEEESYTYQEFQKEIEKTIDFLFSQGLKKGDRINVLMANCSEFVRLYLAGLSCGITIVTINQDLAPAEISFIVNDSAAKALIYENSYQEKVAEAQKLFVHQPVLFTTEELLAHQGFYELENIFGEQPTPQRIGDSPLNNENTISPDQKKNNSKNAALAPALDDEAVIIYTSGTTGNPKGVVLTQLNLLADAKAVSEWFHFTPETRTLCILPLFHNNGQIMTLLNPLYAGGSTVIVKGKASLMSFWGLCEKYQCHWTSVMPAILSILLSLKQQRTDRTMQGIFCGGQPLTASVQENFEKRFKVPVFEGFGLTETTSFACFNYFPAEKRQEGSVGIPLPVNEIEIFDENDRMLEAGKEGEICIRGLNVAREYLGLPERNTSAFRNGWFHSGDFGYKDDTGHIYFKTRKDFLIIKGGENIYPAELENVLFQHPAVAESAVIGIPDKLLGEDICAFVKLHEKEQLNGKGIVAEKITELDLKAFCKGKIANYKQAKKIIIIDQLNDLPEIPKGPTKKVLYRKLRDYYQQKCYG